MVVLSDGSEETTVDGSLEVVLSDGSIGVVDLKTLSDPDGRPYSLVGDAYQEDEGGPIVYETRLVRADASTMTDTEREAAYLSVYPEASSADLEDFRDRVARGSELPPKSLLVDDEVLDFLEWADAADEIDVFVRLDGAGPLELPSLNVSLLDEEPAYALELWEARQIAVERRKTEIAELQSEIVAFLTRAGATIEHQCWPLNGIAAVVDASTLEELLEDPSVTRIEALGEHELEADTGNNGAEIRSFAQVQQFHDAGVDGSIASQQGMSPNFSSVDAIYVGIIDQDLDPDHPAWDDDAGDSRLVDRWACTTSSSSSCTEDTSSGATSSSHGNAVTGLLLSDLMDDQDASVTDADEQAARTGMAPGAKFSFIDWSSTFHGALEFALEDFVFDVVNLSAGDEECSSGNSYAEDNDSDLVNDLYMNNVFVVKSAGNNSHDPADGCTVSNPAGAAGAFVAGSLGVDAHPLTDSEIGTVSSRGGDGFGRAIVDLLAPSNHESTTVPNYNNTYSNYGGVMQAYTSYAAPHVSGASAVMKHHLLNVLGTSMGNKAGVLSATMLLMGDGRLESGSTATATTPYDELYGAGRMRMRRFSSEGMDAPWRARWIETNIEDGQTISWLVNPDGSGVNQDVPNDAEWFKAAVWWYEPNLYWEGASDPDTEDPAQIRFKVCNESSTCYTYGSLEDEKHRLWLGSAVAGHTWTISFQGVSVPASTDPDHWAYGQQKRTLYAAMFWEDRDSDDGDGPDMDLDGDGPDTGIY